MIGSTTSLLALGQKAFTQSMENGTLRAGRIKVTNATPEIKATLEASYQEQVRSTAQTVATARASPSWATFDDKSNDVELPDVQSLSKSDATHVANGLQYLLDIGRLDGKTVTAKNGDQSTDNIAVYKDWLQAHIGVDVQA